MGNYVGGYGNPSARLVVVGEAPGKHEVEQGIPFVGPSGDILNEAFREAGIDRSELYLTNVVKVRPPESDIKALHLLGKKIEDFLPQLWEELETINPYCILAIGGTALEALTGHKGIEKYRGSILRCHRTGHKVISTLNPASLLHEARAEIKSWKELAYIKADIKRAAEQALFREVRLPNRTLLIARNSLDVMRFFDRNQGKTMCTTDVETFKTYPQCLGWAFSAHEAISVPLFVDTIPNHDLTYIWRIAAEFFADVKIRHMAQNAKFDEKRCRQIGMKWHDVWFDMMLGWHVLYPEFPKKLQFISSIITDEPYYKDEGKEYNPKRDSIDRLLLYNCKDAAVEFECCEKILAELKECNLYDFCFDKVMPLHRLYSNIEDVGILIDMQMRAALGKKYQDLRESKRHDLVARIKTAYPELESFGVRTKSGKIKEIAIEDFNCDSPQQVAAMVYGFLGCPLRKDTGEDTLKALVNNTVKDQNKQRIITGILVDRKIGKTMGTYLAARTVNNRIYTQYRIDGTESGRTSTAVRKPPIVIVQDGIALQTMTKHEDVTLDAGGADLRSMFIADPGFVFIEADLSQAEDRVVTVLSKDWDAVNLLQKKDFKYNKHGIKDDRHTITAMMVCEKRFDDITDYDRQIGKRIRHAGNYDMGKHQGMLTLGKFGVFVSEWRVGKMLDAFHAANSKIRLVFHAEIEEALHTHNCRLVSPHGRARTFFNKWGSELFKEAYSFIPQATVSDQVKVAMLRICKQLPWDIFKIVQESHDSFLALCKEEHAQNAIKIINHELTQPINFTNCTLSRNFDLVIPCDIKVGRRWVSKSKAFPDGMG